MSEGDADRINDEEMKRVDGILRVIQAQTDWLLKKHRRDDLLKARRMAMELSEHLDGLARTFGDLAAIADKMSALYHEILDIDRPKEEP